MDREQLIIFTDGSCYSKHPQKLGGCGVYIQWKDKEFGLAKGFKNTTIDRMEIRAILMALKSIKKDMSCTATFYIDRQNVANTFKKKFIDWQTGNFHDIINYDLWDQVFKEVNTHKKLRIKVNWIPSHQKDIENSIVLGNLIADHLADYKEHEFYENDQVNYKYNFF